MRYSKKPRPRPALHVTGLAGLPAQISDWEWELLVPLLESLCREVACPASTDATESPP
jgi:hypothetical protein